MKVTIDPNAGFCFGVERAIRAAEANLVEDEELFSLGMIVHNEEENKRLRERGLKTVSQENFINLKQSMVLFRAHGEPPSSYKVACRNGTRVIDATCPVVKKLQSQVAKAYADMVTNCGSIVIFGKKNHPEVEGLVGQTHAEAIVIQSVEDVQKNDFPAIIRLFAQTTMGVDQYQEIKIAIENKLLELHPKEKIDFKAYNSICGQVSGREKKIRKFASENEIVIFVAGENSSNGKHLYGVSKEVNPRSYYISRESEIDPGWFENADRVGVTGATSSPDWLLENVKKAIESL